MFGLGSEPMPPTEPMMHQVAFLAGLFVVLSWLTRD